MAASITSGLVLFDNKGNIILIDHVGSILP